MIPARNDYVSNRTKTAIVGQHFPRTSVSSTAIVHTRNPKITTTLDDRCYTRTIARSSSSRAKSASPARYYETPPAPLHFVLSRPRTRTHRRISVDLFFISRPPVDDAAGSRRCKNSSAHRTATLRFVLFKNNIVRSRPQHHCSSLSLSHMLLCASEKSEPGRRAHDRKMRREERKKKQKIILTLT